MGSALIAGEADFILIDDSAGREVARGGIVRRLRRLADLGFDDAVLLPGRPTEKHLAALRALG
jgi:succinylarginine dihydrolase